MHKIEDLLQGELTFLVGAGCSIAAPSCLPAGKAMSDKIIEYTCAPSEINKIKQLRELRFEQLVEIIRNNLDPDLRLIDYYMKCDKPNFQHFYFVEQINRGNFVMTTNFDCLIEYALLQSENTRKNVIPVITKMDFEKYNNPQELFDENKKSVYKIHGSSLNIVTEENTKNSLISTMEAFGSNKEGLNVFQLESFKKDAFVNLTKDRTLVVMGYSGSDDFDVVPTIKVLKGVKNIVWVDYQPWDTGKEIIIEIHEDHIRSEKVDEILRDIKEVGNTEYVYKVRANTGSLIRKRMKYKSASINKNFSLSPTKWFKDNIRTPKLIEKYYITYKIFDNLEINYYNMEYLEKILSIAKEENDKKWQATALGAIGKVKTISLSKEIKRLDLSIGEYFKEALKLFDEINDLNSKEITLNNFGLYCYEMGSPDTALDVYKRALKINKKTRNLEARAVSLNGVAEMLHRKNEYLKIREKDYRKIMKKYNQALTIFKQIGNLQGRADCLNNIGRLITQFKESDAIIYLDQALEINKQIGNPEGQGVNLYNMGEELEKNGKLEEALEKFAFAHFADPDNSLLKKKVDRAIERISEKRKELDLEKFNCGNKKKYLKKN